MYGVKSNAALERTLGLSTSFCTMRIKRGTLPFELIYQAAIDTQASFDQLVFGNPVKQVDGNDLLTIKQGLLKTLLRLKSGELLAKADSVDDLDDIAKILSEGIENELMLHWDKHQKDSA